MAAARGNLRLTFVAESLTLKPDRISRISPSSADCVNLGVGGMFKLSKKADYGLIAVKHLALHRSESHACSASEIAEGYGISSTLMAKVLQKLARHSLVGAKHGSAGGYQLAKDPESISALEVITAIDGPVLITSCVTSHGNCDAASKCSVREPLRRVNESILQVLSTVTISQMCDDPQEQVLVALRA
jgi:FeS assembly SUF system regulator